MPLSGLAEILQTDVSHTSNCKPVLTANPEIIDSNATAPSFTQCFDSMCSLVLTFDLNHNFRYLVKSILKCFKYNVLYELD